MNNDEIAKELRGIEVQVAKLVVHSESDRVSLVSLLAEQSKRIDHNLVALGEYKLDFKQHIKEDDNNFKRIDKTIYIASGFITAVILIVRVVFK